jgi:hypothetical protein
MMEEQSKYIVLPQFTELHFNEENHIYTIDMEGQTLQLPSVTQILRFVSREIYSDVPAHILENAADRGTRVHEAIEMSAKFGWMEADTDIMPYMLAYQEWEKEHGFKVLASEYKMYHSTRLYAGTADVLFFDGDDLCLMDIKTTKTILEGLTTAQLYGYTEALKSHGVEVVRAYILHLKNDSTFDWIEVDTSKGRMMFEACAYLHGVVGA